MLIRLLDNRFAVAEGRLDEVTCTPEDLYEAERVSVKSAVERRRHEFIAGRVLARRAMAALGEAAMPIPVGPDRCPVWPRGLVGSITHSDTWCAAAVARVGDVRSVGIDVEDLTVIEPEVLSTVCTVGEMDWLSALPAEERMIGATTIFSAKETVFKAQYPLTGKWLGHHDVEIAVSRGWSEWTATRTGPVDVAIGEGGNWKGRVLVESGMIATAVVIPA